MAPSRAQLEALLALCVDQSQSLISVMMALLLLRAGVLASGSSWQLEVNGWNHHGTEPAEVPEWEDHEILKRIGKPLLWNLFRVAKQVRSGSF